MQTPHRKAGRLKPRPASLWGNSAHSQKWLVRWSDGTCKLYSSRGHSSNLSQVPSMCWCPRPSADNSAEAQQRTGLLGDELKAKGKMVVGGGMKEQKAIKEKSKHIARKRNSNKMKLCQVRQDSRVESPSTLMESGRQVVWWLVWSGQEIFSESGTLFFFIFFTGPLFLNPQRLMAARTVNYKGWPNILWRGRTVY